MRDPVENQVNFVLSFQLLWILKRVQDDNIVFNLQLLVFNFWVFSFEF